jgi:acyl dehydratase
MSNRAEEAAAQFQKTIGTEEGPSEWIEIDQSQVNAFADCTHDHQFIHVDLERAKQTPFGTTIAHGFLTLALLPHLQSKLEPADASAYAGVAMGINYGLDKVRFPQPVKVGSKVRGKRELLSADVVGAGAVQLKHKVTVEIDGEAKPACVAEALTRLVYA